VIAIVTDLPSVMVVHPSVPCEDDAEFCGPCQQNPEGSISARPAPVASAPFGRELKLMAGIEMTHVPYKGAGPALA